MIRTNKWLIFAFLLLFVGILILGIAMINGGLKLFSESSNLEETVCEITEEFDSISLFTHTTDITVLPSEDGKTKVVFLEDKNEKHTVNVSDGVLKIVFYDKEWYEYPIFSYSPSVTVYLAESEYKALTVDATTADIKVNDGFRFESADIDVSTGNVYFLSDTSGQLKIEATTGDIHVNGAFADSVSITVTTGDIYISELKCTKEITAKSTSGDMELSNVFSKNLSLKSTTGDIELNKVIIEENFRVKCSSGDVELSDCDGGEINIETSTGEVEGTILSAKIFITKTSTGEVNVPENMSGGKCKITTSTGNIDIRYSNK